jgi:hypothetical protein
MLDYEVERIGKRREFGLFIVLFQHLLGGAEESYKKPKPVAQEYKAEVTHRIGSTVKV